MAILSAIVPEQGFAIGGDFRLKFPTLQSYFQQEEPKADITQILKTEVLEDTTSLEVLPVIDSSKFQGLVRLDTGVAIVPLEYNDAKLLDGFFQALMVAGANGPGCRIMHYGDSQIEVDRITGYLRSRLQGQFGGSGPGLLNIMPVAEAGAYKNTWSDGWERYTIFTRKDARVPHKAYGPLAAFSRYLPFKDSTQTAPVNKTAWLTVTNTKKETRDFRSIPLPVCFMVILMRL